MQENIQLDAINNGIKQAYLNTAEQELLINYDEHLKNLGLNAGKIPEKNITTFFPMKGNLYNHELMVVGRAVNGWEEQITPEELLDNMKRKDYLRQTYLASQPQCPLSWVTKARGGEQYNTNRSAFWRVIHKTLQKLEIGHNDKHWPSYIVWSNLYKTAPYEGGNPSGKLINIQQRHCAAILKKEIYLFKPKKILFLTGYDWAKDVLNKINEFHLNNEFDGLAEARGQFVSEKIVSKIVIAKHPQGKDESRLVDEVIMLFNT